VTETNVNTLYLKFAVILYGSGYTQEIIKFWLFCHIAETYVFHGYLHVGSAYSTDK